MNSPVSKTKRTKLGKLTKIMPGIWLAMSIATFLGGLSAFVLLFVLDFNVYWLILAPVILAIYQSPAAYFFWLYKKTKRARSRLEKKSAPDGI
jgi:formate hydrogenlyase subunit 3/multisubunit Na+/H+ antiporter MnhD subunit